MIALRQNYPCQYSFDRDWILGKAKASLQAPCRHITDSVAPRSAGSIHDFYSNGDYWWPNPETADGLPFVRRDGESYPGAFFDHRTMLRQLRTDVANLAAGYRLTGQEPYAGKAVQMLREFFLEEETRMNPSLQYAQAIPGVSEGRGIGIIDTLHLIDLPFAVEALRPSPAMTQAVYDGLVAWFKEYLHWMVTSGNGREEMVHPNNHSICFFVQLAAWARFVEDAETLAFCRKQYREVLIPNQMAPDGSFPQELARTKPYSYSMFVLDNVVTLCHLLSEEGENDLWHWECDGRSIGRAVDFLYPYLADKSKWPYPQDVEHYDSLPARMSFMVFAGAALGRPELFALYDSLPPESQDDEVRRNVAVRQPILWL